MCQPLRQRLVEAARLVGGLFQQGAIGGKQLRQQPIREGIHAQVPVDQNAAVGVCHLGIQRHLRPLGNHPFQRTKGAGDISENSALPRMPKPAVNTTGEGCMLPCRRDRSRITLTPG